MVDLPVWAEIDLGAITHNTGELCRLAGKHTELIAVVKANGYGHGSVKVAKAALAGGATRLAVARIEEAIELRDAGIQAPVLILGYTPPKLAGDLSGYSLEQTVYSLSYARALDEEAGRQDTGVVVHVKVDTGMGRLGVVASGVFALDEVGEIAKLPNLEGYGIYTHFACADAADKGYAKKQLRAFLELLDRLGKEGITFKCRHCANSAAIIEMPESRLDAVRAGISLYGLYPSPEVDAKKVDLVPAMSFKTRVVMLKKVRPGTSISYGCTYVTDHQANIATLPVGYADGFSRLLSSRAEVLVRGRRAPVVGRICMDQCMIDVSRIHGVCSGDEVVLFGRQGHSVLPVEEQAARMGTINYELVCMVGSRVPRIYLREGETA